MNIQQVAQGKETDIMFDTWNVFGISWFPLISPALVILYMVRCLPCGGGGTSLTTFLLLGVPC